jgi:hypothetical protein
MTNWRNETDLEKAKMGVLTFIRAYESLRRDDGSYLHDPSDWRNTVSRTEVLNALSASTISIGGFIEQPADQTQDQIRRLQDGKPNPYPTSKALAQKALDALVEEGLLEIKNLAGGNSKNIIPAKYRVTEAGRKYEIPPVNIGGMQVKSAIAPEAEAGQKPEGSLELSNKWKDITSTTRIHLTNDGVALKPNKKGGWEIE